MAVDLKKKDSRLISCIEAHDIANKHVARTDNGFRYRFSKSDLERLVAEVEATAVHKYIQSQTTK